MKAIYILIIGLFFVTSCNSPEENNDSNMESQKAELDTTANEGNGNTDIQNKISNEWVLVKRESLKKDTTINFSATPPSIITQFKISGFFSVSDLIEINSDQGKTQQLENRVSGQWEFNDDQLVMRFGTGDSTSVRTYQIEEIDEDNLVLKNVKEDVVNTYIRRK